MCRFVVSFPLLLLEAEVTNQREVVGRITKGRKSVWPDLLLGGHVQDGIHSQRVLGVPDVVQSTAALPRGPNLPRCVLRLRQTVPAEFLVSRVQAERRCGEAPIHLLIWDCVEIPAYEQRYVGGGVAGLLLDHILEMPKEV